MTSNFLPFDEARKYVKSLKLKSEKEWTSYCKSGKLPSNIPLNPESVYRNKGWSGYPDWLRIRGKYFHKGNGRWSFEKSREYVHKLNIKGLTGWIAYCKSEKRPPEIPASPHTSYRNEGWEGYGDWTGTGRTRSISFLPFDEARQYVQKLKIKNRSEYNEWAKSKQRPSNIPSNPERTYKKEWKGNGDWLHVSTIVLDLIPTIPINPNVSVDQAIKNLKNKFLDYDSAKKYVRNLKLKNQKEWIQYTQSGKRPKYIPGMPWLHYDEWSGFSDWLGTKRIRPTKFLSFEEARSFVHSLKFKKMAEWEKWVLTDRKPANIPANPVAFYSKTMEWTNVNHWLGTTPAINATSLFLRRSKSRINELKLLNYSELDMVKKLSQEYPHIDIVRIDVTVKKILKDHS
ncbi:hypothetical protein OAH75_01065 [Nitrosopumilus sp.]|nr:integrase repeat-containing protein [Nitrosopumilus sp.]MDB4839894.1 hypothetical protein [Nitrosopumilus sp.]